MPLLMLFLDLAVLAAVVTICRKGETVAFGKLLVIAFAISICISASFHFAGSLPAFIPIQLAALGSAVVLWAGCDIPFLKSIIATMTLLGCKVAFVLLFVGGF